ncbi:MAG: type II secretion system F family protein [Candidatus Omnitrophica bacterium]|jgi:tight adherence protein C|nr:type II secretion system F family protein [Candidatus Omnitrophota bacterium]MDD5253033.1 type II secretion system F family protein [Candidatus Omnitrophota bacterium]
MGIIIFFLIIGAIGLITWGIILSQRNTLLPLPSDVSTVKFKKSGFDFSRILPTQSFLDSTGLSARIKKNIDSAHLNISPVAFFNLKILLCITFALLTIIIFGKFEPLFMIIAVGIGYVVPDFYLKRKISKRKYLIARGLPETVDLLGLCIEAGLDFVNAVKWIIDKTPSTPMTEELAFVLEEIKWGKPRIQSLKDMAHRLDIPELSSFVQTIIQAERMGTPVAEAFTILSEDTRSQRFHRGERVALQAPIKILLPLIFFIMPVIGIVIGGPILITFMQGGLTGFK